jgi:endoglucanase
MQIPAMRTPITIQHSGRGPAPHRRRRNLVHSCVGTGIVVWLIAVGFGGAARSQAASEDAFVQNQRLGRGVNVLGYDPIWRSPDQARFQARHFATIKQGGFDTVRVNLHPFRYMGPAPDFALKDSWWKTADWIVTNALTTGLNVIVDFHEFNAMGENPEANKPRFLAFWQQVSTHFRAAPPTVVFEILNEPCKKLTPDLWNSYLAEALALIRATNPARTVIVGPAFWNSVDHLDELQLPEGDRNLIVTVHYYKPMTFTHQGAAWTDQRDKLGVEWRGAPEEQGAIDRDFDKVQSWSKKHGRPIFLGEFGAYDKAEMASRARYTAAVARTAERLGWSWAYWQFDSDFIVYDVLKGQWIEPIRQALVPDSASAVPKT